MLKPKALAALAVILVAALIVPPTAGAQVDRIRRAAQREVERQAERMIGDAIACSLGDEKCVEDAKKDGKEVVIVDDDGNVITDENGNPVTDPEQAEARAEKPGEGVWRNYDFTPGAKVWFVSDFTDEPVGRFPGSQLEFVQGNMEIVEWNEEKVLEVSSNSEFNIVLPEALPEDFTLEFYLKIGAPNIGTRVMFSPREGAWNRYESHYLDLYQHPGISFQGDRVSSISGMRAISEEFTPIKLQVDGEYAILYVGTQRAGNVPNAKFMTTDKIHFYVSGNQNLRSYLKDLVVAVGVEDMYGELMESGEFTTRGIFFDFDSDVLRPESTPVLQQIIDMMESHSDLRILIEGHTDSTGEEDYNQELSERRAASVVAFLVENGIDGGRMASAGKGETEPVADNATAAGQAENRRVVIRVAEE